MKTGDLWYRRQPIAFLGGIQGLSAPEIAVYSVTLDLIYQHDGPIHNDPKWIAGWISDMGAAAVRNTLRALMEKGKLFLTECGRLHNPGAAEYFFERDNPPEDDAKTGGKRRENRAKTGGKRRENGGKTEGKRGKNDPFSDPEPNDNNNLVALARVKEEKRREEIEEKEPYGSQKETDPEGRPIAVSTPPEDPPPGRAKPATAMPRDAGISKSMLLYAITKGLTEAQARDQFEAFKDHALSKRRLLSDWDAGWRNWLRSPYQSPSHRRTTTHAQRTDDAFDALGEHLARKSFASGD